MSNRKKDSDLDKQRYICGAAAVLTLVAACFVTGCGYSQESLYPENVTTVYVEMFDNKTFWRGQEYDLTNAIGKRIEADTPYRVYSDRSGADTIMTGYIESVEKSTLVMEPEIGRPLEQQMVIRAVVSWRDRRTGEMLMDKVTVAATADFSQFQSQGDAYSSKLAANRLAESIVGKMRKKW
jgi:hypothetical protein